MSRSSLGNLGSRYKQLLEDTGVLVVSLLEAADSRKADAMTVKGK
jgi:hypothetical protein